MYTLPMCLFSLARHLFRFFEIALQLSVWAVNFYLVSDSSSKTVFTLSYISLSYLVFYYYYCLNYYILSFSCSIMAILSSFIEVFSPY